MRISSRYINELIEGKSPQSILDEEDSISVSDLASAIQHELRESNVKSRTSYSIADNVVYVVLERKTPEAFSLIEIYESAYPEIRVLVTTNEDSRGDGYLTTATSGAIQDMMGSNPDITPQDIYLALPQLKVEVPPEIVQKWIDDFRANGAGLIG